MKLSFHGADRTVTGSCHMVECTGKRILIDCGLRQGSRELDQENADSFGFDPAGIDYVLLTHAHLDHCGRLPLLAKRGFPGEIVTTAASRELARLVMLDAAHLQEEDARYRAQTAARHGSMNPLMTPLYSIVEALNSFDHFGRTAVYGEPFELAPGVRATFIDAGHILGSASIFLQLTENSQQSTVLFSGDLGKSGGPLLYGPAKPPNADNVVMETTYGDRLHKPLEPSIEEFLWSRAPSSQAQSLAPGVQHRVCRIRRRWHSGTSHHRWRQGGEHFGRTDPGASSHLYDQRFLRPCGQGRAVSLAQANRCRAHVPRSRRRRNDAKLRGRSRQ